MNEAHQWVERAASLVEYAGVAIILAATLIASLWFVRSGLRSGDWLLSFRHYRSNLGRGILLGLELLVGADIIATITAPLTLERVGLLGLVVLIRTFLSFSLEAEIEGCWPWQRARNSREEASANG